jgi:hypothetical protein
MATIGTSDPGSSNVTGEISSAGYSYYMCLQTITSASTEPGDANQKTITIQYDEQ